MSQFLLPRRLDPAKAPAIRPGWLLVLALLCAPAFALNPDWNLYQFGHRAWKIDDGYLGGQVTALTQDRDGYLWMGTANGLFRFDGARFTQWSPPGDGTRSIGYVFSLLADRDGSLWIGSIDGVDHWDHHRLTHFSDSAGQIVNSLVQDETGTVWFAPFSFRKNYAEVICKVANEKLSCFGQQNGIPRSESATVGLARDQSGTFWLARSDSVISWRPGSAKQYGRTEFNQYTNQLGVSSLAVDGDGSLLVGVAGQGSGKGLQRLRNGQWSTVTSGGFDGSKHKIICLYLDRHGALWIGTENEGIYRLNKKKVDHFDHSDGLSGDFVRSIYEDREGSIWVSTSDGLDQLRDLAVRRFSRTLSAKRAEFDNVVTLPDGAMWIGGAGALFTLPKDGTEFMSKGDGLAGKQVTTIFGDHKGRIWIGLDNTLNLFVNGRFAPVKMQDGGAVGFIVSMAEDADGTLFAITTGPPRTLLIIDPATLKASTVLSTLDASKIAGDPQEGIWIGTNDGRIEHLSQGKITNYPITPQAGSRIAQLSVMPGGTVMASGEFGIAFLTGGTIRVLGTANGLPCSLINNFIFDKDGDLWLYAACGLVRLSSSELRRWEQDNSAKLTPRTFDSSDGFEVNLPPFEGVARSTDGRLWFNNQKALLMIDPSHIYLNSTPPPVHIQAIRADFRDYPGIENVVLPPLTRDIEIDHVALSYTFPDKNRFRYRLSGFDSQWHDVGARIRAVYMNLRPGTYTFQVIACNNDGVWNESGASLNFTIVPAWYQTVWFRFTCVVIFAFALWVLYRLRLRQVDRQFSARLEERVGERTRIARELHDTLLQSLHGLLFQFQAARNMLPRRTEDAQQTLDEAIAGTEQAIAESRDAIHDLRMQPTAGQDLAELLEATGEELIPIQDPRRNSPSFRVIVEGNPRLLSPILQAEIYRIAREVLRNAVQHADANHIEAELRYDDHQIRLRIRDDGKGIAPEILKESGRPGHWGLPGVRERADRIGADLRFWSEAGAGTEIELTIPATIAYDGVQNGRGFDLFKKERKL